MARSTLSGALQALSQALLSGWSMPIRAALSSANAAVTHLAPLVAADAEGSAELDAIRLELDAIAVQLETDRPTALLFVLAEVTV